ncbi:hypothetical protein RclHR1_30970002 [Rhizophagus clarus]|uniref:Aspartic peptidase DDI1-type domain-containing protein n=1 Tax=Rhizophagus clarus TaxID=94130 RepID=A0A2Z6S0J7_9GLOM|nr:hypothetical protein RclHR1_30970002 [Rhizophagus clarus]
MLSNLLHTSRKCSRKKKKKSKKSKKSKVNLAIEPDSDSFSDNTSSSDSSSDSDTSSSDSSDSESDITVNIIMAKKNEFKLIFPDHFFQDSNKADIPNQAFPIQASIVENISLEEEENLDNSMEIDFIKKKEPKTSVATVKCKIRRLKILAMTFDSGAEPPIITENIIERVGDKINKSEIHNLSSIVTNPIESIRVVHNLPITLSPELTIIEDFIIVKYYPLNGKDYIIPVTMHKIKNKLKVNCARTTSECDASLTPDKISQNSQDLSEEDTLKKSKL